MDLMRIDSFVMIVLFETKSIKAAMKKSTRGSVGSHRVVYTVEHFSGYW